MHPRLAIGRTILVVFLVAACQQGPGPASPGATDTPASSQPPASAVASPPDAGATIDPNWVTRPALTCGDPERLFPPEALDGLGLAEREMDPAALLLRRTIAEAPDLAFPATGWHRVLDDPGGVTFVAPGNAETPWFTVTIGMLSGTLQATEYGQCNLAIAAPNGINLARWWLDPDGPLLTPDTTTLSILVREVECASGKPPEGRVLAPTIVTTADSFQIAIAIREQATAQDCQGNPAYAVEVVLPDPLGARGLFDASEFPARPVTTDDPE